MYTLQVHIAITGIVIHCIGLGCQSCNPRKYTVLNENFVFDLHNIFQDCIPGIKRDLPLMFVV